tara:strand:- start:2380 stop:2886 length:507 start_codon:yes stop_codon:yes gene_type:complete
MADWNKLAANYRPMEGDVLHPDDCVVIRIKGAEWRVRPLQLPEGIMYTPEFGAVVEFKQTIDPLGNEPMQNRAAELVEFAKGGAEGLPLISAVCNYLSGLLDQQYSLPDEVKGELLCFRGEEIPAWVYQALRHAHGIRPQETIEETVASLLPEEPEEQKKKRRWWHGK